MEGQLAQTIGRSDTMKAGKLLKVKDTQRGRKEARKEIDEIQTGQQADSSLGDRWVQCCPKDLGTFLEISLCNKFNFCCNKVTFNILNPARIVGRKVELFCGKKCFTTACQRTLLINNAFRKYDTSYICLKFYFSRLKYYINVCKALLVQVKTLTSYK